MVQKDKNSSSTVQEQPIRALLIRDILTNRSRNCLNQWCNIYLLIIMSGPYTSHMIDEIHQDARMLKKFLTDMTMKLKYPKKYYVFNWQRLYCMWLKKTYCHMQHPCSESLKFNSLKSSDNVWPFICLWLVNLISG